MEHEKSKNLEHVLVMGIIKEYDLSPKDREAHDREVAIKRGHVSSRIEGLKYLSSGTRKKLRPVKEGEKVQNPWTRS